ncbi:hypothetical protein HU200_038737 [Digitaria exilis]|uniref:Secreted protein n=1 Tax=Digitaria exilis TaxID=1010633 RepID=A0A835EIP5_9POAL|nr:hypothetical protein HU200_038737 [Digitaria exilis]
MGTLRLMPRMLALMAVQRHTAASKSTSPCSSGQHWLLPETGRLSFSRFSTLAHTSSFNALIGHDPPPDGVGTTGGGGTTGGVGQYGAQPRTATAKVRMDRARKRASFDGAIAIS